MALRAGNSALHWTATRPEDNTPATAVAVGHFVQVRLWETKPQGGGLSVATTLSPQHPA